jgi:hypothetical protein
MRGSLLYHPPYGLGRPLGYLALVPSHETWNLSICCRE